MSFPHRIVLLIQAWLQSFALGLVMTPAYSNSTTTPSAACRRSDGAPNFKWNATFFYVQNLHSNISTNQPTFIELNKSLRRYHEMSQGILRQLSLSHEVALRTEHLLFPNGGDDSDNDALLSGLLSTRIETKLSKVAELLEKNLFVLESILKPFPIIMGLSRFTNISELLSRCISAKYGRHSNESKPTLEYSRKDSFDQMPSSDSSLHLGRYIPPYQPGHYDNGNDGSLESDDNFYNDASQILTHMTRDWSDSGESIREQTYGWIVEQLWRYHTKMRNGTNISNFSVHNSILSPVLVPGAGMARLAFDIAFSHEEVTPVTNDKSDLVRQHRHHPFAVEAIDSSVVMASAAYRILHVFSSACDDGDDLHDDDDVATNSRDISNRQSQVYPFVSDPFTNEVDTERRWEADTVPGSKAFIYFDSWNKQQSIFENSPDLSYTIGDFVATYASRTKHNMYGSIVTCFFLDTATNIYEYIVTIKNLLRHGKGFGGVWINIGPVHWHRNSQLQPSVDELRQMIQQAGFEIDHWELETVAVGYRHPDDVGIPDSNDNNRRGEKRIPRFTRSESYRPLKFVARLCHKDDTDALQLIDSIRLSTGRRSANELVTIADNGSEN